MHVAVHDEGEQGRHLVVIDELVQKVAEQGPHSPAQQALAPHKGLTRTLQLGHFPQPPLPFMAQIWHKAEVITSIR